MNSSPHTHQTPHHHHSHLIFGQLPPHNTYESATPTPSTAPPSAPITVDTSSPPLQGYSFGTHPPTVSVAGPGPVQQPQQPTQQSNGGLGRRGPGSIKWTKEGVSTSAERRLPFVHRFRPVGLPPPVGLVTVTQPEAATSVTNTPGNAGPLPHQVQYSKKGANKMSQYDTNPVGALQERYQSRGILPFYRVVHFEGMSHNPVFTYQVTIGEMTAIGNGNSKKQAKHAAARAMLDKLDGRTPATPVLPPNTNLDTSADGSVNTQTSQGSSNGSTSGAPTNPIGKLQEYCVKFSLPLPIYDLANTIGQPHQRNFEMCAKVGTCSANGSGTSKKDAKRNAASNLLTKLKGMGNDLNVGDIIPANGNGNVEEEIELAKNVANMKLDTLNQKHGKVLQDFYKKLQESGKAKLLALHRSSLREPNLDYVRLLAELGQEQGFEITYVDIEERSASGENQCLVQLSTLPVAVCYGVGQNQATANNDAARHALNYLKLMTKKSTQQNPDQQQMANKAKSKATNGK